MIVSREPSRSKLYYLRSLMKEASKLVKRDRIIELKSLEVATSGYKPLKNIDIDIPL